MGWNGIGQGTSPAKPRATAKSPSPVRGLAAGAVLVAAVIGCYFAFFTGPEKPQRMEAEKKRGLITEVKPAVAPKVAEKPAEPSSGVREEKTTRASASAKVAEPITRRAPRGTPRLLEEALERGERVKPLFRFPSENYLALYAVPGDDVPPTPEPDDFEQDMINALASPIEIADDDTDEDIDRKRIVAGMKEELREYIKQGGDLKGYVEQMKERQRQEAELVANARAITQEAVREENADPEHCLEVWTKANAELSARGIPPVPMPRRLRTYLKRNTSWDGKSPLVEGMKAPKPTSPKPESKTEGKNE